MEKSVLGLDVGGVIHDWIRYDGTDFAFDGPRYLEMPPVEGAFGSIKFLNEESPFAGKVYLVSRSMKGSERNLAWLAAHGFWEKTGIPESHFNDCKERYQKLAICTTIGVTHFVDDRSEVLGYLAGTVPYLFLFQGREDEMQASTKQPSEFTEASSWVDLVPKLLESA